MLKQGKQYRKQLLKMLKSGKYDFIVEQKGYMVNNIRQYDKLAKCVAKNKIKFGFITDLKESLIIVKK